MPHQMKQSVHYYGAIVLLGASCTVLGKEAQVHACYEPVTRTPAFNGNKKLCPLCKLEDDDMFHFLFGCELLDPVRDNWGHLPCFGEWDTQDWYYLKLAECNEQDLCLFLWENFRARQKLLRPARKQG